MRRILQHTILWIVALSILNTSIDVADNLTALSTHSGQVEYMEIESIVELLMDSTIDQTLPDQKGNDQQTTLKKLTVFDFSFQEKKEKTVARVAGASIPHFPYAYRSGALSPGFISFFSPPPDHT
ncbi:MAG TPA: hypothetical protein PLL71_09980 [Agriterribacter sp.]|nr:hypothetical protein [Agriterribacter sp.]HRQ51061.1 hypothetical protein [Agriterribacter sp.]